MPKTKSYPATKTRRAPSAPEVEAPAAPRPDFHYVVGPGSGLKTHDGLLMPGAVVPGAHAWPRVEAWVNTGKIVRVEGAEQMPESNNGTTATPGEIEGQTEVEEFTADTSLAGDGLLVEGTPEQTDNRPRPEDGPQEDDGGAADAG